MSDTLLSEIERQQKYLDRLPEKFDFPLFNSKQALESQRRNGYRNTAAAAREIVDNAIEAGAKSVHVLLERPQRRKSHQPKEAVSAVAFLDDGPGMLPKMARYALSWGAGTHFDEHAFIGKFGFGLPNSSINQTRRVEVYTKTAVAKSITKAWLDLDEVKEFGTQSIPEPMQVDKLPAFVQRYLDNNGLSFNTGTVVVWVEPDRLTYKKAGSLREHLVDDFGVTYRYLLKDFDLTVDGKQVEAVDPLFLDPKSRFYLKPEDGGAVLREERVLPVKLYREKETGEVHLAKISDPSQVEREDEELIATGGISYRVARFPYGFVWGSDRQPEPMPDGRKRFEVRKTRRGMCFVRANREVETWDAFPRSQRDIASGLGDWPLLQGYAYHWAIEVKFEPTLDEVFGITNDKQTVRPLEDFWRLLEREDVDDLLRAENAWQSRMRHERREAEAAKLAEASEEPTPAELAAAAADVMEGTSPKIPDYAKPTVKDKVTALAEEKAEETGAPLDEIVKAMAEDAKRRPYLVDFVEDPVGPFYEPSWGLGTQVVVKINKKHPFFTTLYAPLLQVPGGAQTKQAVDLVLIALAKAELETTNPTTKGWYEEHRTKKWSPYLARGMKDLSGRFRAGPEDTVDTEGDGELGEAAA